MQVLFSTACVVLVLAAKLWTWVAKLSWDWQGLWISLLVCTPPNPASCKDFTMLSSFHLIHCTLGTRNRTLLCDQVFIHSLRSGKHAVCNHRVMDARGRLLSTKKHKSCRRWEKVQINKLMWAWKPRANGSSILANQNVHFPGAMLYTVQTINKTYSFGNKLYNLMSNTVGKILFSNLKIAIKHFPDMYLCTSTVNKLSWWYVII